MARTYVRSFRLEEELGGEIENLPKGTANTLVNELLAHYFANAELQAQIPIKDERFPSDAPVTLNNATEKPPKTAKPKKKKPEITVVSQTDVTETTEDLIPAGSTPGPQFDENFVYQGGKPEAPMPPDFLKKETIGVTDPDGNTIEKEVSKKPVVTPAERSNKPDPSNFLPGF